MRSLLALPVLVMLLGGCGAKHSIVGTWKGVANGSDFIQKFNADNTFESSVVNNQVGATVKFALSGSYTFDGQHLTTAPNKVDVTGLESTSKAVVEEEAMKPTKANVEFKGDDEISLTSPKTTVTLKRQK